jgi:hypothetical protein
VWDQEISVNGWPSGKREGNGYKKSKESWEWDMLPLNRQSSRRLYDSEYRI